jgi:hypothetical protein
MVVLYLIGVITSKCIMTGNILSGVFDSNIKIKSSTFFYDIKAFKLKKIKLKKKITIIQKIKKIILKFN